MSWQLYHQSTVSVRNARQQKKRIKSLALPLSSKLWIPEVRIKSQLMFTVCNRNPVLSHLPEAPFWAELCRFRFYFGGSWTVLLHPLTVLLRSCDLWESGVPLALVAACCRVGPTWVYLQHEGPRDVSSQFSSNSSFKRRKQLKYSHMSLSRGNRDGEITGWAWAILPSMWLVNMMSQPGWRVGHRVAGGTKVGPCALPRLGHSVGAGQAAGGSWKAGPAPEHHQHSP